MNTKHISVIFALVGVVLLILPIFVPTMAIIDSADSLDRWMVTYGFMSLDTNTYYDAPSSVAWQTNATAGQKWHSYLLWWTSWGAWMDWRTTPLLNVKIFPSYIPSTTTFDVALITAEGVEQWTEYYYSSVPLTVGVWNNVTIDLRNPYAGQVSGLSMVRGVRLHWNLNSYSGADFITYVDRLEVLPLGPTQTLTIEATSNGYFDWNVNTYSIPKGTTVTVSAIPSSGYELNYFILDDINVGKPTANTIDITMDLDHSLNANFKQVSTANVVTVTISSMVGGTTDPLPGVYEYTPNTELILRAIPDEGYVFSTWVLDSGNYTSNPITITVGNEGVVSESIQAVFEQSSISSVDTVTTNNGEIKPPQFPLNLFQLVGVGCLVISGVFAIKKPKRR